MAAAAILDNFEWPYLRNGSRSTYIARSAHRAVIFAIAQYKYSHIYNMYLFICILSNEYEWMNDVTQNSLRVTECALSSCHRSRTHERLAVFWLRLRRSTYQEAWERQSMNRVGWGADRCEPRRTIHNADEWPSWREKFCLERRRDCWQNRNDFTTFLLHAVDLERM